MAAKHIIKVGVLGSSAIEGHIAEGIKNSAVELGRLIAERHCYVLTGATTGLPSLAGVAAREHGALHVGVSPAHNVGEHTAVYGLPSDGCDVLIHTGFGLKGRNVVLVRSSDIVIVIGGSIGSLNELTIAYDEGKVIGCLEGTGGVADQALSLLELFPKKTTSRVFYHSDPSALLDQCLGALHHHS